MKMSLYELAPHSSAVAYVCADISIWLGGSWHNVTLMEHGSQLCSSPEACQTPKNKTDRKRGRGRYMGL